MQKAKYKAEFKEEAVRQVLDRGHSVIDVAKRLGIGLACVTPGLRSSRLPMSQLLLISTTINF